MTKSEPKLAVEPSLVTMADGSVVEFGKKGILKKSFEVVGEGAEAVVNVLFNVRNGDQHRMKIDAEHPSRLNLIGHGASQKVGDCASGCTPDDASYAVQKAISQLEEGVWIARASGVAKGMTDFLKAVLIVKGQGKDTEEGQRIIEKMKALDDDTIKKIRNMPAVKVEMHRISFERTQSKAAEAAGSEEAGDLLDSL